MALQQSGWALIGVVVVALLYLGRFVFRCLTNPLNVVPGPRYAQWTNLRLKWVVITGQRIHYVHELHKRYGNFVRVSPQEVSVADPEAFDKIHRIGSGFNKSKWYQVMTGFDRPVLFSTLDPKAHAVRRKLLARAFSKTHLREHWEPVVHGKIRLAICRMSEECHAQGSVDILKWWTLMATDIATHLMFGESFHMIENGGKSEYMHALETSLKGSGIGAELPLVRAIGKRLPFKATKAIFVANHLIMDTAKIAVVNARSGDGKNLFAHMMEQADKGEGLDDVDVQMEASGLTVAASDTTAITLTYLVWAVLSNPNLKEVLLEELENVPDDYDDQQLEDLVVLNAVIEETLRLYGAAPGATPRVVPASGTQLGPYFLPPSTIASTQAYTMHRNADIFPSPLEFDYTRWLPSEEPGPNVGGQLGDRDRVRNAFAPFGAGSRICIGIHLARMELRLATFEFFRRCGGAKLAPTTTPESMEMENFFFIAPKSHKCHIIC